MYEASYYTMMEALDEFHETLPDLKIQSVNACAIVVEIHAVDGYAYRYERQSGCLYRVNWDPRGTTTLLNKKEEG